MGRPDNCISTWQQLRVLCLHCGTPTIAGREAEAYDIGPLLALAGLRTLAVRVPFVLRMDRVPLGAAQLSALGRACPHLRALHLCRLPPRDGGPPERYPTLPLRALRAPRRRRARRGHRCRTPCARAAPTALYLAHKANAITWGAVARVARFLACVVPRGVVPPGPPPDPPAPDRGAVPRALDGRGRPPAPRARLAPLVASARRDLWSTPRNDLAPPADSLPPISDIPVRGGRREKTWFVPQRLSCRRTVHFTDVVLYPRAHGGSHAHVPRRSATRVRDTSTASQAGLTKRSCSLRMRLE